MLSFTNLISNNYDWDIDQFMYGGNRLLNGELPWINEFDDKLPIVHYLFALPAYLKSVYPWVIFNFLISIITSYYLYKLLINLTLIYFENLEIELTRKLSKITSAFYLFILVVNSGSIFHINSLCSNLTILTVYFLNKNSFFNEKFNKNYFSKNILFASLFASIAISIRPYLFWPIIFLGLWQPLRMLNKNFSSKDPFKNYFKESANYLFFWIIQIAFWGLFINFTPYINSNKIEILISTLKINSIDYGAMNTFIYQIKTILRNPFNLFNFLLIIVAPLMRINLFFSLNKNSFIRENTFVLNMDILFFIIISPLLLEISFLSRHYFDHYSNLLSPYVVFSLYFILVSILISFKNRKINIIFIKNLSKIFFIFMLTIFFTFKSQFLFSTFSYYNKNLLIKKESDYQALKVFIDSERELSKTDFLFPLNNYIHWKMNESRKGFPMAAVFKNITKGNFDKVYLKTKNLYYEYLLSDKKSLCRKLSENGTDIIISYYGDFTYQCLDRSKDYILDTKEKDLSNRNLYVFRKNK